MRHAFLIQAHESPLALVRLVRRLRHPRASTYVHLDRKTVGLFDRPAILEAGASIISSRSVNWGGFSSCEAQLDLLRMARREGPFDTYTLISGLDYPVMRIEDMVGELDGVIASKIECLHQEKPWMHRRYERRYFYDYPLSRVWNSLSRRLEGVVGPRTAPEGIRVCFGWAWWTLTEEGVEAVERFVRERPDVVKWLRYIYIADEAFFQTALANVSTPPKLDGDVRRYIRWTEATPHPKTIGPEDLEEALSGDYWFTRKVDERRRPGVSDEIDVRLGLS